MNNVKKHFFSFYGSIFGLAMASVCSGFLVSNKLEFFSKNLPGCGPASSCSSITEAPWGVVPFTYLPVSFVGFSYFITLFILFFFIDLKKIRIVIFIGGAVSLVYIAIMLYLWKFCIYCFGSHVGNFLFLISLLLTKGETFSKKSIFNNRPIPVLLFLILNTVLNTMFWFRFVDVSKRQKIETETSINEILNKPDNKTKFAGRYILGDKESPIKVVMISDYQCPDCLRFEKEIMTVVKQRTDTSLSVKHFPFSTDCNSFAPKNLHPNSCWAAKAAETAGLLYGNDGFWKMHKWLFSVQGEFTEKTLPDSLKQLGFDSNLFIKTMSTNELVKERVETDIKESIGLGLYYTPMIFVNGKQLRWYGGTGEKDLTRVISLLGNKIALGNKIEYSKPETNIENMASDWENSPELSFVNSSSAHVYGKNNAKNTISVWCDSQFPKSKDILSIATDIVDKRKDTNLYWYQYPLNSSCNNDDVTKSLTLNNSCNVALYLESISNLQGDNFFFECLKNIKPVWKNQESSALSTIINIAQKRNIDIKKIKALSESDEIKSLLIKQVDHKSKTQVEFNRKSLVKKPFYLMVAVNNKIVERWISPTNKKDAVLIEILERIQKKQDTNE